MKKIDKKHIYKYFIIILAIIILLFFISKSLLLIKKEFFTSENTIYIIGKENIYMYFEDYINSFIDKLPNAKLVLYNNNEQIPNNNINSKFIFLQTIPDGILDRFNHSSHNIYLINTEQLSKPIETNRLNTYPKFIKTIDYSKGNIKYYTDFIYPTKFIEYQINMKEIYNLPKNNNICIMYGLSPYRKHIIDKIRNKGYNVDEISGWGQERDKKLFTYKIIINISQSEEYKLMEPLRCHRCIFNKMIVISNKKEDQDLYSLKDYMIFEDYDKLADKVIEVFNNYDKYYKQLGLDTMDLNSLPIDKNVNIE